MKSKRTKTLTMNQDFRVTLVTTHELTNETASSTLSGAKHETKKHSSQPQLQIQGKSPTVTTTINTKLLRSTSS